ncbi:MAG: hypothetical protein DELT_02077 [Desulfovibrio sp.]
MTIDYYEPNDDFNPGLVSELLLEISVAPETGARLGVPAAQLEVWLCELAGRLNDGAYAACPVPSRKYADCGRRVLSLEEVCFLLEGVRENRP